MATRNPANVIEFGSFNFGATVTVYAIAGAVGADSQVAPGEDMEKFLEAVSMRGTIIGLGSFNGGAFDVHVENSSWENAAAVEAAIQAVGGVFAAATVA
jgi:hypothetical protein